MADPREIIEQQHTIIMPQNSVFSLLAQNMTALAWLGVALSGFAAIIFAWERKAEKKDVAKLEKRIRTLEKQVVRVQVLLEAKKR